MTLTEKELDAIRTMAALFETCKRNCGDNEECPLFEFAGVDCIAARAYLMKVQLGL